MPDNHENTDIQIAWIQYVKSVRLLLVPQVDDRPLDQYLVFRDTVIPMVESERFLDELNNAWKSLTVFADDPAQREIGQALLLELKAFPLTVEVAQATSKPEEEKSWWRRCLGRATTVSCSVGDLLENLPPYAKNAITLFNELIDLFKGGD